MASATDEQAVNPLFVDTLPNPQAAEGGEAQGDRQGGRRRNRRGGRGRDRDDARPGDRNDGPDAASPNGETMASSAESAMDDGRSAQGAPVEGASSDDSVMQRNEGVDAPVGESAAVEPRGEGSRRRGRGGRGRDRERAPRDGESMSGEGLGADRSAGVDPMSVPFSSGFDADSGAHRAEPRAAFEPSSPSEPETRGETGTDSWHAQEPAQSAPVVEHAAPRVAAEPAAMSAAPAPSYALPLDSLVAVAESAGLQWVNSDAAKIEAAQAAMAAAAEPIHVPRDIPPVAAVDEGPLVLVETKKDLSQVKLPFETTPRETQGV